jgi:hypothetical protein
MGLTRSVDTDIWTHHGIVDLSANAKLLYLWLYINPQSDRCGCVRFSERIACAILRLTPKELSEALRELSSIVRCFDGLYAIRGWIDHNCNNPKWLKSAESQLAEHTQEVIAWVKGTHSLPIAYRSSSSSSSSRVVAEGEVETEAEFDIPDGILSSDRPTTTQCPHNAIVSAYHEALPMCPTVQTWGEHRQKFLRSRWKEDKRRQSVDWWERFFGYVAQSDFLTGRNDQGWRASLEWLIRPRNFAKVIDGQYHNDDRMNALGAKASRTMDNAIQALGIEVD